jgi:hypothetical protein
MQAKRTAATKPTRPPTTPPAIAPAWEEEPEEEVEAEADAAVEEEDGVEETPEEDCVVLVDLGVPADESGAPVYIISTENLG